MFSRRNGIIFDLDNTLVPTVNCYENVKQMIPQMLCDKYNIDTVSAKSVMSKYDQLSSFGEPYWEQEKFTFFEWREHILDKSVKSCTDKDIDISELHKYFQAMFLDEMKFSDKLKEMLLQLRQQFKLAILTNGDPQLQKSKLRNCDAEKYFDAIVVSYDYKMMKPDPRIFHIACRKIGLENHQCIMVGDLLGADIIGSQRAGLKGSVYIKGKDIEKLGEIQPDHTIDSILELKNVLHIFGLQN